MPRWHMVVTPAASICSLGGPVRKPYARVDYIPQSGTKSLASEPRGGLPTTDQGLAIERQPTPDL